MKFAGSHWSSVRDAADAYAAAALPDTAVIAADEGAEGAAERLEATLWADESVTPEGAEEATWRHECREALLRRILRSRVGGARCA